MRRKTCKETQGVRRKQGKFEAPIGYSEQSGMLLQKVVQNNAGKNYTK